jgi:hypothetical protein
MVNEFFRRPGRKLDLPAGPAAATPLTKRQQNQPFMVNALLSVVVYFV